MTARRRAESWGRRAETLAAWWLRAKGYRVLARRVKTRGGEIDLVVRRGRWLAFVEVKARASLLEAAESVTATTRRRIGVAANSLVARYGTDCAGARFDTVLIRPWRLPVHVEGAWLGD
jgi:putative endonuclease